MLTSLLDSIDEPRIACNVYNSNENVQSIDRCEDSCGRLQSVWEDGLTVCMTHVVYVNSCLAVETK